jgi:hypothetical protein
MNINSDPFRSISLVFLIMVGIMLYQMYDRKQQEVQRIQGEHRAEILAMETRLTTMKQEADERQQRLDEALADNARLEEENHRLAAAAQETGTGNCATQVPTATKPDEPYNLATMIIADATTWTIGTTGAFSLFILMGLGVMRRTGQSPDRPPSSGHTSSQPKAVRPLLLRPIKQNNQHGRQ